MPFVIVAATIAINYESAPSLTPYNPAINPINTSELAIMMVDMIDSEMAIVNV